MGTGWNENLKWCFSPLGTGDRVGVNNAGIGIFTKHPYRGLAKEILQNIIDAKDPEVDGPAKAVFEKISIPKTHVPGYERLSSVIKKCYEKYHEGDDGEKMLVLKTAAEELLDKSEYVSVLKISDYNTIGLTGTREEQGSNWTGLVREVGATNKGRGMSGAFGVGKFAPFNFSALRTIIYSTLNKDGETAIQGKTILTAFKDDDMKLKQNVGLFGLMEDEDCKAVYNFDDVPEEFRRDETGTDLYVIGFKENAEDDEEWEKQILISVLDYFFYTIDRGKLEVTIKNGKKIISVNSKNLSTLMSEINDYCIEKEIEFNAPIYWNILHDESGATKHYVENFRNKGNVELFLQVNSEFSEKRILEMREAGMTIQEDSNFRIGAFFRGIFIATGEGSKTDDPKDNINSFLRKCENQAHDTWSKDEYEGNKKEADLVIKDIHKWILGKVKEQMPDTTVEEIDAFGLSDLLPNQFSEGAEDQREAAYAIFKPVPVDVTSVNRKKTEKKPPVKLEKLTLGVKKQPSDILIPDPEGDKEMDGGIQTPGYDPGPPVPPGPVPIPRPIPGPFPTPTPVPYDGGAEKIPAKEEKKDEKKENKVTLKGFAIHGISTPYDKKNKKYRISFIPEANAENLFVRIRTGADDDNKSETKIFEATHTGEIIEIKRGLICIPEVKKNEKVVIEAKLVNPRGCPLEVTAYVK